VNSAQTDALYDGLNPVQEGALPTTPAANLLTGLGVDELFTRTDAAGLRAFLPDALGSAVALADASGTVQTAYTYAPFGETTVTGTTSDTPYQFTGRENDGTNLYYYRARYYHPVHGQFLNEDPLEFPAREFNKYRYALDNPVTFRDPLGLFDIGPIRIVEGGIGATIGAVAGAAIGGKVGAIGGGIVGGILGPPIGSIILGPVIGPIAGGTVGITLGPQIGAPIGAAIGGIVGGVLGGTIGSAFDERCDGVLNCDEPPPPVPSRK
jgi:RHS repeat-associated protein